jgi:hypothetical protein
VLPIACRIRAGAKTLFRDCTQLSEISIHLTINLPLTTTALNKSDFWSTRSPFLADFKAVDFKAEDFRVKDFTGDPIREYI